MLDFRKFNKHHVQEIKTVNPTEWSIVRYERASELKKLFSQANYEPSLDRSWKQEINYKGQLLEVKFSCGISKITIVMDTIVLKMDYETSFELEYANQLPKEVELYNMVAGDRNSNDSRYFAPILRYFQRDNIAISLKVDVPDSRVNIPDRMRESLKKYRLWDFRKGNVGFLNGKPVLIDYSL